MAARNIYKVKYQDKKWFIQKDNMILGRFASRKSAVRRAILKAKSQLSSQVIIFRPNGSIQESICNFECASPAV
jgi:hypothetical protein